MIVMATPEVCKLVTGRVIIVQPGISGSTLVWTAGQDSL